MAVVGVGHFGRIHAEKILRSPAAKLVAVADIDADRAAEVGRSLDVPSVADYSELLSAVDAVSVVVPTHAHYQVANDFLSHGADVLVEKPITDDPETAARLVELAHEQGRILQVGHLERFSARVEVLRQRLKRPLFIDSLRIAPFKPRGTDVNVILDIMIHDLDLVLSLVDSPIASIDAAGAPVFSPSEDIASARIKFANGCIANIAASRISLKTERRMRIFALDTYVTVDFDQRVIKTVWNASKTPCQGMPQIEMAEERYEDDDPLQREIDAFIGSVVDRRPPVVSGEDGLKALEAAVMINESLRAHASLVRRTDLQETPRAKTG